MSPQRLINRITETIKDQKGLTLVEIIASSFIFFAVLIPLVSVYIRGVEIYQVTSLKNQLRNEADFIVGDVMRKLQDATYFEVAPVLEDGQTGESSDGESTEAEPSKRDILLEIIQNSFSEFEPRESIEDSYSRAIYLYKRAVTYEKEENTEEESGEGDGETEDAYYTRSVLSRETRSFAECSNGSCDFIPFPAPNGYVVDGLFEFPDQSSLDPAAKKRVILYLVVALREDFNGNPLFDHPDQIENLKRINQLLSSGNQERERDYIRVIRTEIDASSLREG